MVEVKRTLVKSIPELWEIVNGQELIDRLSTELFRSQPLEVVEREPSSRLVCRVAAASATRVELILAEEDWGTRVAIRVNAEGGAKISPAPWSAFSMTSGPISADDRPRRRSERRPQARRVPLPGAEREPQPEFPATGSPPEARTVRISRHRSRDAHASTSRAP
jgi:hypothetical protein